MEHHLRLTTFHDWWYLLSFVFRWLEFCYFRSVFSFFFLFLPPNWWIGCGAVAWRNIYYFITFILFHRFFFPSSSSFLPSLLPIETKKNGFFLVVVVDCVMILRLKKFLILLFKYILNSVSVDGWKGRPWAPSPVECSFHRWFDSICGCGGGRTDGSTGCISTCIWFILRRRRRPDRWQHRLHFHLNRIF